MTAAAHRVGCLVVGAGAVGLAAARALAQRGREVLIVEANGRIGEEASSRSNEVVHAGFLYAPGSLKERLCLQGRALLIDYCAQRGIGWRRTGKLVPACDDEELASLRSLARRVAELGLSGVHWLDVGEVQGLEPAMRCAAALYSADTGIVDSHALMLALLADAEAAGAVLATRTRALRIEAAEGGGFSVALESADLGVEWLACDEIVNAAGLGAWPLARTLAGYPADLLPRLHLAHGSFYAWQARAPFRHLVMPLGDTLRGGGAFTLDLAGQGRFGPLLQWVDQRDYRVVPDAAARFAAAIRRYWPQVDEARLAPSYAGIQPRTVGPEGGRGDWVVQGPAQHGLAGLVNLFAIDSPGLTACLATAEHLAALLDAPAAPHLTPRIERSLHAH